MARKFNLGDAVRVTAGAYLGTEGTVTKDWKDGEYTVKSTKLSGVGSSYRLGAEFTFVGDYLELVTPDVREVGKKIKPELIKIGDKIRAVKRLNSELDESRSGVVGSVLKLPNRVPEFYTSGGSLIGYTSGVPFHYVLEEASTVHELTLAPVGTKFKAVRGPGSAHYLIYTKYREGWWICEAYNKGSDEFEVITVRSEKTTINEFDKGRSTYL